MRIYLIPVVGSSVVDQYVQTPKLFFHCSNQLRPHLGTRDIASNGSDGVRIASCAEFLREPVPKRSAATTLQPSETKSRVIARPKPDAAPAKRRGSVSRRRDVGQIGCKEGLAR